MKITLRTPTTVLFDGEADAAQLKTDLGLMELLPNHATLVGTILYSTISIRHGQEQERFVIRQGSVAVNEKNEATILATEGHKESEMTVENMEQYLEKLAEQLKSDTLNDYQKQFLEESRKALQEGLEENSRA